MTMIEKLRQVSSATCANRRENDHTCLVAIAWADNPYSLIVIFGREHLAMKAGGAVYVTRCAQGGNCTPVSKDCTETIPALHNGIEIFIDPISCVIKLVGLPTHCNDVAPPRISLAGSSTAATLS